MDPGEELEDSEESLRAGVGDEMKRKSSRSRSSRSLSKGMKSFSASKISSSESMNLDRGVLLVMMGAPRGGGGGT